MTAADLQSLRNEADAIEARFALAAREDEAAVAILRLQFGERLAHLKARLEAAAPAELPPPPPADPPPPAS